MVHPRLQLEHQQREERHEGQVAAASFVHDTWGWDCWNIHDSREEDVHLAGAAVPQAIPEDTVRGTRIFRCDGVEVGIFSHQNGLELRLGVFVRQTNNVDVLMEVDLNARANGIELVVRTLGTREFP
jgi:hypothetical protein